MKRVGIALLLLLAAAWNGAAQRAVDPRNALERLLCIVPVIGSGQKGDPRRPMYVPQRMPDGRMEDNGIVSFAVEYSDDGQFALVELVARDREAFQRIFDEQHPQVKTLHKGRQDRADIEREFKKLKRNFDLNTFGVSAQ